MESQSFKNHVRYYPPHHFVFYPLLLLLLLLSVFFACKYPESCGIWLFFAIVLVLIGWLSFMTRQHYALNNQNRIVRLEMRFRYYVLTGQRLEDLEDKLSFGQIAALRFAGDEELVELVRRAYEEQLSPKALKKMIRNWQPDNMRV